MVAVHGRRLLVSGTVAAVCLVVTALGAGPLGIFSLPDALSSAVGAAVGLTQWLRDTSSRLPSVPHLVTLQSDSSSSGGSGAVSTDEDGSWVGAPPPPPLPVDSPPPLPPPELPLRAATGHGAR